MHYQRKTIILSKCYWRSMEQGFHPEACFQFYTKYFQFIQNISAARSTYKNSYRMQYVSHGRFLIPPKGYENENKRINFSIQQNYINFGFCCWVNQMLKYVRVCLFHKLVWWLIIPLIILVIDVQHHYSLAHLYLMEILFQLMFRICNYG